MDKKNLNSVAIVDEGDDSLVANTSGSDLGVFLSGRHSLHMPVLDFFAEVNPYIPLASPYSTRIYGRFASRLLYPRTLDDDVWLLYIKRDEVCTTCAGRSVDAHASRAAARAMWPGRLLCCVDWTNVMFGSRGRRTCRRRPARARPPSRAPTKTRCKR